jgi:prepilin-type N-terminal cleavage/methylation domain-containing protein
MKKQNAGFTLIEVLIAVAIMSTLGLLAAQTIKQAITQKKIIQEIVNDTSRLRDGVKIFEKDVQLIYHHRDWEKEIIDLAKKTKKAKTTPGGPAGAGTPAAPAIPQFDANGNVITEQPEAPVEAPRKDPVTNFIGKENEVHFVTMNTGRILKDMPQADFIEVGYSVKECTTFTGKKTSKCLYRRVSPWVDDDVTKGGDEFVLIENVTEFALRYLGRGKQDWNKDWRSDQGGDGATKGNFPWLVEISITYQKEADKAESKKHSMQLVIPIHFPNNKDDSGSSETTSSNTTTPAAGQPAGTTPTLPDEGR